MLASLGLISRKKQFFEVSNIFGMLRLTFEVRVSLLGFVPDLEMGNPSLSWLEPPQMGEAQPGHWQRRVGRPWEMGRMIHGSRDMESWSRGVVVMSPKDFQRKDIFKFQFFGFLNFSRRLATSGSIVWNGWWVQFVQFESRASAQRWTGLQRSSGGLFFEPCAAWTWKFECFPCKT